ncbi:hypothetical protein BCR34DRAFT_472706, partial [Clohesyomyces aquaticus]
LREGKIFSAFTKQEQEAMWLDILSKTTNYLILSLLSFFVDVYYLKALANYVKALVELWLDKTMPSALERIFTDAN